MNNTANVLMILEDVHSGNLKVFWNGWSFSGGRDHGDEQFYALIDSNDDVFGTISINDIHGVTIRKANDELICYELNEANITDTADRILYQAILRDDKKLVNILSHYGDFPGLPRDYHDITRDDVLSGRWPEEYCS